jgi:N-acetyl-anhydromuramyl-L-alanine amidase AmpD
METIASLVKQLIELLTQYMATKPGQEPERPTVTPTVVVAGKPTTTPIIDKPGLHITEPIVQVIKGVHYKTHGHFATKSGKARGLVVHYTVSGRSQASAKGVVQYLASQGLGCPVMDENGIIYVPENFNWLTDVVYHAGVSSWKGVSGISAYNIGMEMCNWGTDAEKHGAKDLRKVSSKHDNQKIGTYQMYTAAQEKSLINVCLWLKKQCPEFDFDWVVGHDEIAPTRKEDPGGSLSMSMPALRQLLKA